MKFMCRVFSTVYYTSTAGEAYWVHNKCGAILRSGLHRGLWGHTHNNCSISVRGHFISRSHPKGDPSALFIPSLFFLPPVFERF